MTTIRAAVPEDMGAVASMFLQVFRSSSRSSPDPLARYLRELLFESPEVDPELPSFVALNAENVVLGFICVLPLILRLGARAVRAACAGSLMVADPARDPMIGARLIRAYMNGPQELSLSESANALSRNMWEKLGGRTLPAYSIDWFRVLRPAGFAVSVAERKLGLARALRPFGGLADRFFGRGYLPSPATAKGTGEVRNVAADDPALAEAIIELSARYALHPDWSGKVSLPLRLSHAARKRALGPLHCRFVKTGDRLLGAYAFYAPRQGIAQVLLFLPAPRSEEVLLDHLLGDAAAAGCVGVRGRCQPEQLGSLLRAGALLAGRSSTVIKTRDAELDRAIKDQGAWITGLACESWIRLIGDEFFEEPAF